MTVAADVPQAYLTGSVRFMEIDLVAAPGALVPREETELLGRAALEVLGRVSGSPTFVDMCCGSGNLVCALAARVPAARAWASDLTDETVKIASINVDRLGIGDRVTIRQGDLFAALSSDGLEGRCDLIVCNPPYISTGKLERESAGLLAHEPRAAFDGGPYGVSIVQRVIREAVTFLKPGGILMFEIGAGQERQVAALFARSGQYGPSTSISDAQGQPRVMIGVRT